MAAKRSRKEKQVNPYEKWRQLSDQIRQLTKEKDDLEQQMKLEVGTKLLQYLFHQGDIAEEFFKGERSMEELIQLQGDIPPNLPNLAEELPDWRKEHEA